MLVEKPTIDSQTDDAKAQDENVAQDQPKLSELLNQANYIHSKPRISETHEQETHEVKKEAPTSTPRVRFGASQNRTFRPQTQPNFTDMYRAPAPEHPIR